MVFEPEIKPIFMLVKNWLRGKGPGTRSVQCWVVWFVVYRAFHTL